MLPQSLPQQSRASQGTPQRGMEVGRGLGTGRRGRERGNEREILLRQRRCFPWGQRSEDWSRREVGEQHAVFFLVLHIFFLDIGQSLHF